MLPRQVIDAFDGHLSGLGLRLEAVVVGGSALALLEVITRETRDFDILAPELADELVGAAKAFARLQRAGGVPLDDAWLNNGPLSLGELLPDGWRQRLRPVFAGRAIQLTTLGHADLLKTKLFAYCDRGTDLLDCVALAPSAVELADALPWVAAQDGHPDWPDHVAKTFAELGRRLGHGE